MKLYISGKMSGEPEFNYPRFDQVEAHLKSQGHDVVNPANIGRAVVIPPEADEHQEYTLYMKAALRGLLECDTIYMLDGWTKSPGANIELNLAEKLGYKVIYER